MYNAILLSIGIYTCEAFAQIIRNIKAVFATDISCDIHCRSFFKSFSKAYAVNPVLRENITYTHAVTLYLEAVKSFYAVCKPEYSAFVWLS